MRGQGTGDRGVAVGSGGKQWQEAELIPSIASPACRRSVGTVDSQSQWGRRGSAGVDGGRVSRALQCSREGLKKAGRVGQAFLPARAESRRQECPATKRQIGSLLYLAVPL